MDTTDDQTPRTEAQRDAAEVLADAVQVLTEAARLRRPVMQRGEDGKWRKHPKSTHQADWAEFVTQALAGAAANIGSVDAVLAGRPGSWEADAVRNLLHSTVGYDEQYLFEHRTEPLHVVADVEQILDDLDIAWLYDDAETALYQMQDEATAHIDYTPYEWTYTRDDNGQFVANDPQAPPWSIDAWRAAQSDGDADPTMLAAMEDAIINGPIARVSIAKSPEAERAVARLAEREDAILTDFQARFDALCAQRAQEWATYAEEFAANVRREAERLYPGTRIHTDLTTTATADETGELSLYGLPLPEEHLVDHAVRHTPLPGSGIAPKDYPPGTSIHDAETAAGRLPHLRLPDTTNTDDPQERR